MFKVATVLVMALFLTVLAACGGSSAGSTPTAPPTATPTAPSSTPAAGTPAVGAPTPTPTAPAAATPTPTATPPQTPPEEGGDTLELDIVDFVLPSVTVAAGTTVAWTNRDAAPHTATADDRSWDSGTLRRGDTYRLTFNEPGQFRYFCVIHPSMIGVITVE